jgi:dihydroorotate dehydrogenase
MIRSFLWSLAKRFLFLLDAERAHRLTVAMIRLGIRLGGVPLRIASGGSFQGSAAAEPVRVFGLEFQSRVGLAAGFDKDAEVLQGLPHLGFGFAEIGTVTPRPQSGNDRPRLFRDPSQSSLFNRMGFNGQGAEIVSANLRYVKPRLPSGFRVGVNVGKNKDTPAEDAARDYGLATAAFKGLADYLVINVSSPNTPGLRALQTVEALKPIVGAVSDVAGRWSVRPPVLLKLAPEVRGEELASVIEAVEAWGIDGWILTNTLAGTWRAPALAGGWSGGILTERSRSSLIDARSVARKPIISVGGILSPEEATARIHAGASLVQLYSGWVFRGPGFPAQVAKALR